MAYYCSAGFDPASGALFVASGIEGDNYARVVELVREQVALLAAEGPTPEELALCKHRLVSRLEGSQDTPPALVSQHFAESVSGAPRTTAERIADIQGITPEAVRRAAQQFALDSVFFLAPEGSNAAPVLGGTVAE
jgi:predicted Zn-dependent peptidase